MQHQASGDAIPQYGVILPGDHYGKFGSEVQILTQYVEERTRFANLGLGCYHPDHGHYLDAIITPRRQAWAPLAVKRFFLGRT